MFQLSMLSCELQEQAQSLERWLTEHQRKAVQQVQQLQAVLKRTQVQAQDTAGAADMHHQNIQLLSQKKSQYDQQFSDMQSHLASVGYAPQVKLLA